MQQTVSVSASVHRFIVGRSFWDSNVAAKTSLRTTEDSIFSEVIEWSTFSGPRGRKIRENTMWRVSLTSLWHWHHSPHWRHCDCDVTQKQAASRRMLQKDQLELSCPQKCFCHDATNFVDSLWLGFLLIIWIVGQPFPIKWSDKVSFFHSNSFAPEKDLQYNFL